MITLIKCENLPNEINQYNLVSKFTRASILLDIEDMELTIVFETNNEMQTLNNKFRKVNKPTDVLSFESDLINPETGKKILGDIIVSAEKAISQAKTAGHTVEHEILILVIHGILHLLKYDHVNREDETIMYKKQREVFEKVIG